MRPYWIFLTSLLVLVLSGCGTPASTDHPPQDDALPEPSEPASGIPPTAAHTPAVSENGGITTPSGQEALVRATQEDLAGRLAIPVEEIDLVEVIEVEWPDSSLGCPQPGMGYLQVITPGYKITFQANGQNFEYHASQSSFFVLCDSQSPPVPPKPQ